METGGNYQKVRELKKKKKKKYTFVLFQGTFKDLRLNCIRGTDNKFEVKI